MAYIIPIIAIAGAVIAAAGTTYAIVEGEAAKGRQQKAAADAANLDAELKDRQAQIAETNARLEGERRMGRLRATAAKTGVVPGTGSLLEVELEAARLTEYDVQLQAYGARVGAVQDRYRAKVYQFGGSKEYGSIAGGLSAAGGAANILGAYMGTKPVRAPSQDIYSI